MGLFPYFDPKIRISSVNHRKRLPNYLKQISPKRVAIAFFCGTAMCFQRNGGCKFCVEDSREILVIRLRLR